MENRVHVIARSVSQNVDVGQIMIQLGGGGHKMAASAVLKGVTLIEAREKLISLLHQNLKTAGKGVSADETKHHSDRAGKETDGCIRVDEPLPN